MNNKPDVVTQKVDQITTKLWKLFYEELGLFGLTTNRLRILIPIIVEPFRRIDIGFVLGESMDLILSFIIMLCVGFLFALSVQTPDFPINFVGCVFFAWIFVEASHRLKRF